MELSEYRAKLDAIDDQMAALFKERMETVKQVADYKKANGVPVMAAGRERDILYRVTGLAGGELEEYTKILWSTLLELSRDYQENRLTTGESPCAGTSWRRRSAPASSPPGRWWPVRASRGPTPRSPATSCSP